MMKAPLILLYLLLKAPSAFSADDEQSFNCTLAWESVALGDPLPEKVVMITNSIPHLGQISSAKVNDVSFNGRVQDGVSYLLNQHDEALSLTSDYQVLTNPYGCSVEWVSSGNSLSHQITYPDTDLPIGRASISGKIVAGHVKNGRMFSLSDTTTVQSTPTFEVLTSFSPGLFLEMTDFIYLNNIDVAEETIGMDDIHNLGPAELVQKVTVKQRIFDSTTFSFTSMSSRTHGVTASVGLFIGDETLSIGPTLSLGFSRTKGQSNSKSTHHQRERWVDVTREVVVEPYNSVTVCSTIAMAKEFTVGFIAKGRYSAPGIEGSTIREILEDEGAIIIKEEGDTIVTQERGELKGNVGLSTKFVVVPFGNAEGCSSLGGRTAVHRHTG